MDTLKISISGMRGIVGESLTPEVILNFASAFGTYVKGGKVVVGGDTRPSHDMVKYAIFAGLLATGCEVVDIGVVPTPTVQLMTRELSAAGGMVITASHNPKEWNGIKLIREDGIFLNPQQTDELLELYRGLNFRKVPWNGTFKINRDQSADDRHLEKILASVDRRKIRARKIKVALDSCNGAGYRLAPRLLKELGGEVFAINTNPHAYFPHDPEPVAENLGQLLETVKSSGAAVGFAQDPDADRLAIVDEKGVPIGEEYTLALAVDFLLRQKKNNASGTRDTVVTNLSTTEAIDDIAKKYGARVVRTKIGEVHVSEAMKRTGATVGGEGNGGVILPAVGYGRDSQIGMALVLWAMAERGLSISALKAEIPEYHMVKRRVAIRSLEQAGEIVGGIQGICANEICDLTEGIKVHYADSWVHVRPSNTEPIIRVIAEAKTLRLATQQADTFQGMIQKIR